MDSAKPWLHHYDNEVASTYEYPKHNLAHFLVQAAGKYPQKPAIYFMGKKMNYSKLLDACYRFANGLKQLGVKQGERVAIMLPNCPQSIIAYYGALMAGAIVVQTNPLYMERELEHQLADSGSVVMVTLDLLHHKVSPLMARTNLRHMLVTSIKDYLPFPKNILYPIKAKRDGTDLNVAWSDQIRSFRTHLSYASPEPVMAEVEAAEDVALLQYTGGTTGLSKGVMLTHYNLVVNTVQAAKWCYRSKEGEEIYLAALPFFHVFGMTVLMNQAILRSGMLVLIPKFDIEEILRMIAKLKPTIFPGAPTMYIALINHARIREYDLSSINVCLSGSAPLPLEVQERFEELTGGRLIEGYGLTEASPATHVNPIWGDRKIGTIGLPFPDTEAKVIDPATGEEVAAGEIGELIVRGPQVMKGYWNRPHETAAVLRDGWLYTGDMSRMDEEGYFSIVDRKKDIIIAGGFNIYPREIEEVLFEHPAVKEAVAIGVPDPYRGETVKAYIIIRDGESLTAKEMDVWCRERLAAFKVPRRYEFRTQLPKTMVGKVLRRKLLEEEMELLSRVREREKLEKHEVPGGTDREQVQGSRNPNPSMLDEEEDEKEKA
ncbi:long-chain fatty acid--CoA ligase [Paenibacillus sp. FJAT-26967]|uniref:long-chain-fatty-acid--CoA ligase n=1 Tax=Paenibacillus sp. FJAT-26967 TaxID=1729690 RepID=UPI000A011A84|nr:long-chain fatty acid--CoA ligase [Paenibacillus sp. FJAT-26967]